MIEDVFFISLVSDSVDIHHVHAVPTKLGVAPENRVE